MKERSKLTADQQTLVSQALPQVLSVARKHARHYGPGLDFEGSVALWLCQQIAKFDPARSNLQTWASWQAHFACRELMRVEVRKKSRNKCVREARLLSLDAACNQDGDPLWEQIAAPTPPAVDLEADAQLLRGLDTRTRTIVWKSIVEEIPLNVIAQSLGVSRTRTSELRDSAIEFLRRRAIA